MTIIGYVAIDSNNNIFQMNIYDTRKKKSF